MRRSTEGRILVVSDANVLINFLRAERFDLLRRHRDYKIHITEHVRAEITYPDQRAELDAAISCGDIEEVPLTDPTEVELFVELSVVLGRGESAAIALASNRRWVIATDELGRARSEIHRRVGLDRVINTPGLILSCVRNGYLTVAEADGIKADLERQGQSFSASFDSFSELL